MHHQHFRGANLSSISFCKGALFSFFRRGACVRRKGGGHLCHGTKASPSLPGSESAFIKNELVNSRNYNRYSDRHDDSTVNGNNMDIGIIRPYRLHTVYR